jgi:uncharacterized damage-inducible protein DinB
MDRTLDATLLHTLTLRLTKDYPGQIAACLDALGEDQLWWRPDEQANAVANLVLHLAGSNHFYLDHAIGGAPLVRDRDAEFAARRTLSKEALRARWDASVGATQGVMAALNPSGLAESTDRTGKPTTIAQILLHVSHHNAAHMGQIVWITKMLRPGALDDIWMKMRTK